MNYLYGENLSIAIQGLLIMSLIDDKDICNNKRPRKPSLIRRIKNKIYSL